MKFSPKIKTFNLKQTAIKKVWSLKGFNKSMIAWLQKQPIIILQGANEKLMSMIKNPLLKRKFHYLKIRFWGKSMECETNRFRSKVNKRENQKIK